MCLANRAVSCRSTHYLSEHADAVARFALEVQGERPVVDEPLVHMHATDIAVRILASVTLTALRSLIDGQFDVVEIAAGDQLTPRGAALRSNTLGYS